MTEPLRTLTTFAFFAIRPGQPGCLYGRVLGHKGLKYNRAVRCELEDAATGERTIRFLAPDVRVHILPSLSEACGR